MVHPQNLLLENFLLYKVCLIKFTVVTHTHTDNERSNELSCTTGHSDPGAVGGVKGDPSPAQSRKEQLPFFSGIPSVEVIKGLLHLYKPKLVINYLLSLLKILNISLTLSFSDL